MRARRPVLGRSPRGPFLPETEEHPCGATRSVASVHEDHTPRRRRRWRSLHPGPPAPARKPLPGRGGRHDGRGHRRREHRRRHVAPRGPGLPGPRHRHVHPRRRDPRGSGVGPAGRVEPGLPGPRRLRPRLGLVHPRRPGPLDAPRPHPAAPGRQDAHRGDSPPLPSLGARGHAAADERPARRDPRGRRVRHGGGPRAPHPLRGVVGAPPRRSPGAPVRAGRPRVRDGHATGPRGDLGRGPRRPPAVEPGRVRRDGPRRAGHPRRAARGARTSRRGVADHRGRGSARDGRRVPHRDRRRDERFRGRPAVRRDAIGRWDPRRLARRRRRL